MVCKSCEAKLSKVAASDPYRNRNVQGTLVASGSKSKTSLGSGSSLATEGGSTSGGRKVGENKLLSSKNRYNPVGMRCTLCKGTVQQDRAKYCQNCAFKKGLCSMCGKAVLDANVRKMSKMSS